MQSLATVSRRVIPEGFEEHPCWQCRAIIVVPAHTPETPTCRQCLRGEAERDIRKAITTFRQLRKGQSPFDVLTPQERAEQIAGFFTDIDSPPPTIIRASVKMLSDQSLIDVIGVATDLDLLLAATLELAGRLPVVCEPVYVADPDAAPDSATRDELESRIELTVEPDAEYQDRERWDDAA